jgi:predicted Zn finger-like uncharacterized protein
VETFPVESPAMQIVCPNCTTSYEIAASALGDVGRRVRCVRCNVQWFEPARAQEMAAADTGSPAQDDLQTAGGEARPLAESGVPGRKMQDDWSHPEVRWSVEGDTHMGTSDRVSPLSRTQDEVEFATPGTIVAVSDAPSIAPYEQGDGTLSADATPSGAADPDADPDYLEAQRRRQTRSGKKKRKQGPLVTLPRAIAAMAGLIVCLLLMRTDVVRLLPQTASLYSAIGLPINLRGLVFENVKIVSDEQDGTLVLTIEGQIRNITRRPVDVPRLRFATRNSAGADIYSWTAMPERAKLNPGEYFAFHTRLASPPSESNAVSVRFVQRSDFMASTR